MVSAVPSFAINRHHYDLQISTMVLLGRTKKEMDRSVEKRSICKGRPDRLMTTTLCACVVRRRTAFTVGSSVEKGEISPLKVEMQLSSVKVDDNRRTN